MPMLERDGETFILWLDPDDENRFHPDWLAAVERALGEAEAARPPCALVTAGSGKFWSNGPYVEWMMTNPDQATAYITRVKALLTHTLASPVISVAALNGHTFGAAAMWALAHDIRVMPPAGKSKPVRGQIKEPLYAEILAALRAQRQA